MTVLSEIGQIRYALVLTVVLTPLAANAVSGTVYGRLLFYNFQGNYCPTSRDCTGANT